MPALALDPERDTSSDDRGVNPAQLSPITELLVGDPDATMSSADPESNRTLPVIGKPDSPLDTNSELSRSASIGLGQVVITERSSADPQTLIQPSLLNETLDLIQSLAITEVSPPNYAQLELGAESREFYIPPTTHLIATVEDLTDMLDYTSEDIDGMDDNVEAEPGQNPPITGRWMATSTYDVYMVDTPEKKDDDGTQDPDEEKPFDEPPKRRRQRRRP
jgi:hypothetical protein